MEGIEAVVNVISGGEPHRGFLVEPETRTGGRTRRRPTFHRGFHLPTYRRASGSTNLLVDTAGCASCGGGGLSQSVAETDGNGNLTALYVRNRDQLLAVMRPGSTPGTWTTRFIHGDGLGNVRALTDESGTTIDTRGYEAFGTKNTEAGNDPLAYGFAGEPFQSDSMLAYHRARWMDARVGRFEGMDGLEPDEMRPATIHRYVYGYDQPTGITDPSGNDGIGGVDVVGADFGGDLAFTGEAEEALSAGPAGYLRVKCPDPTSAACSDLNAELGLASDYLGHSQRGAMLIRSFTHVVYVQYVPRANHFDPGPPPLIDWDPYAGLEINPIVNGQVDIHHLLGVQTPALGLAHELAHAYYTSESDVLNNYEIPIARQLSETVRKRPDQAGQYCRVVDAIGNACLP